MGRLLGGFASSDEMEYGFWSVNSSGAPVAVPPFALSFSTTALEGHALAAADEEGVVTVLDTRRSLRDQMHAHSPATAPHARFLAHDNAIFDIIWMHNDTSLATASGDATVRIFDAATSYRKALLRGHTGSAKCVRAFPTMPDVVVTAARDGNVRAFDLRVPSVYNPSVCREVYHTPVFSIDQPHMRPSAMIAGSTSINGRKRRRIRAIQPEASRVGSVTSLAFYPGNDNMLYTAGAADGTVKLWDIRNTASTKNTARHSKSSAACMSSKCVASAVPGTERRQDDPFRAGRPHGIASLDIDASGSHLLVSSTDSTIYLYNATDLKLGHAKVLTGHTQTSFYIRAKFSPCGQFVVSGSADTKAYIWDLSQSTVEGALHPIFELAGHRGGEAAAVDWCKTDFKIATCGDDSTTKVWQLDYTKRAAPPRKASSAGESSQTQSWDGTVLNRARKPLIRPRQRALKRAFRDSVLAPAPSQAATPRKFRDSDIRNFFASGNPS